MDHALRSYEFSPVCCASAAALLPAEGISVLLSVLDRHLHKLGIKDELGAAD